MNPLAKILIYLLAVVLAAVILSPPIFWLCNALADAGIIPALAGFPFHRYFSRITQIAALVLLWPAARWLRIRGLSELGIEKNPAARRDVAVGIGFAVLPIVLLAAVYFEFDIYRLRKEVDWIQIVRILGTAAVVSAFEEFLFRGVLLGLAIRHFGTRAGIVAVSIIFAIVHFIKPRGEIANVTWTSGFELLGSAFASADGWRVLVGGCVTLFFIGCLLGWVTVRTRSLWLAIGLHAGWILGQQTINLIGKFRIRPPDALLPWVGPNVVSGMVPTGLIPLVALLVTGALVWWYLSHVGRAPRETKLPDAR